MKKIILMVLPTVPYPLRASGISIRYLPIIQHLSQRHVIDLIVLSGGEDAPRQVERLKEYCRQVSVVRSWGAARPGFWEKVATQAGLLLPWSPPNTCVVYGREEIRRRITELAWESYYDTVLWVGTLATAYMGCVKGRRVVVDFVDSPSLAVERKLHGVVRPYLAHRYECWKMRRWEARVVRASAASIYISPVDAGALERGWTGSRVGIVIPNGISIQTYCDRVAKEIKGPSIGFLGNMAYLPNVEAVHWLHEHVFRPLRGECQHLSFYIVGRDPLESVLTLGKDEGVTVTGSVEEIWPYVNAIDVFVFPLWRGTGLKNKVLEVMYAKKPVVTTGIGNEGIGAVDGRHLLQCETALEFREAVGKLLKSPHERGRLGEAARHFVAERFEWSRFLKKFESVIAGCEEGEG